jgi:hypothetical protein
MDDKSTLRFKTRLWHGGVIFLWMASGFLLAKVLSSRAPHPGATATVGDLAAIFFGASSLALIIFSLVVAVAALIQWQALKNDVQRVTEAAEATLAKVVGATQQNEERVKSLEVKMQESFKAVDTELRGRVDAVNGAMIGTLHSDPASPTQEEDDKAYISEAIHHCQRGYDRLKELPGNGKFMALNSLVYFSCLLGSQSKRDLLLEQGRQLRDVGRQHEHLPYAAPYLMSFCRVALVYSSDRDEIEQALAIGRNLLDTNLTNLQKKEATHLVASLATKLGGLSDPSD